MLISPLGQIIIFGCGAEYYDSLREPGTKQAEWILNQAKSHEPFTLEQTFQLNLERDTFHVLALAHWNATQEGIDRIDR
jgi:hypothetical protein